MSVIGRKRFDPPKISSPLSAEKVSRRPMDDDFEARRREPRSEIWNGRGEKWRSLMIAAQRGENRAYEQLLRELDDWLFRYYARRLPYAAAQDARQEVLLAIHANRHMYDPSRPFGPWINAIARYKLIDRIRDSSRFASFASSDGIAIDGHEAAIVSAILIDRLLNSLRPAQARVIRLVKLQGVSIEAASNVTGQSVALVKVNIHRGLRRLAAMVAGKVAATATATNLSRRRDAFFKAASLKAKE